MIGKHFLSVSTQSWSKRFGQYFKFTAELGTWCVTYQGSAGFEGVRRSWGAAEARHCVWKVGLCGDVKRSLVKVQSLLQYRTKDIGDASSTGWPTKDSGRCELVALSLGDTVCAFDGELERWSCPSRLKPRDSK